MKLLPVCLFLIIGLTAKAQSSIDSLQLMKDVKTLSSDKFEGRRTGSKGSRMAQFYLIDRFKQIGIQPYHNTFEYPFYFQDGDKQTMGTNLFGYIKGKLDSVIVVSGHYDHLGIRKGQEAGKDSIYNGADDNASGASGVLAIAAYFKKHPPEHTILFVTFDGEEEGLQGAKAFLKQPPVSAGLIVLNINMDMVSRNDKNELYVCGLSQFPQLKRYVDLTNTGKVKLLSGHDRKEDGGQNWINQSDHYEFYKLKIPALYFGVEDHPDYHQLSDEFEHIQPSFYYQAVQRVLKVLLAADKGI
jgi:hypothetical protein